MPLRTGSPIWRPSPILQFVVFQRIFGEIYSHRMEAVLKPALEGIEVPVDRPRRRYMVPAIELRFEDFSAHLREMTECFLFAVLRGKQIDRGLPSQVGER